MSDSIRVDFEGWILKYFERSINLHKTLNGDYKDQQTHDMWQSYKAGKENKDGFE